MDKAKAIILEIAKGDSRILTGGDLEPLVRLGEMADSSINLTTRFWVKSADYWDVHFDTNESVYKAFNTQGINIPFPQMDVHLHKEN